MDIKYSHSMRQSFQQCPRKIYFRYCAGIERIEERGDARRVGRSYHKGLELLRAKMPIDEVLIYIKDELSGCKDASADQIKVHAYISGYMLAFDDLKRDTKNELRLSVGEDVGIVDCIAESDNGDQYIIEDKTTASFDHNLDKALMLNDQICNYVWLCRENGIEIKGILYRELQKSVHKLNRGESEKAFSDRIFELYTKTSDRYRQIAVDPKVFDLDHHKRSVMRVNGLIREFCETFVHEDIRSMPKNCWSCLGKYGACEFLPLCSGMEPNISDLYKPNFKDPWDGNDFRVKYGLYGQPKFKIDEIDNLEFAEYPATEKLIKFISLFDQIKLDENELKTLSKIANIYFNLSDFEIEQFIRKTPLKGESE